MNDELYLIEYYTKNPVTGEGGWDIRFAWVYAKTNQEAREKVKTVPLFDEVITCGRQAQIVNLKCKPEPVVVR